MTPAPCGYFGEYILYHEEFLSLQPMFPPKPLDNFPPEGGCSETPIKERSKSRCTILFDLRVLDYRRARKVVSPRPMLVLWTRRLRTPTQSAHTYPVREQCRRWKHKLRPRRSSGVPLAYTDPSDERQQAPSTPQQWGPPSLHHRCFRRVTTSTVHVVMESV